MSRIAQIASRHFSIVLVCLLSVALGAALVGRQPVQPVYAVDQSQRSTLHSLEDGFTSVANELEPAVVSITSEMLVNRPTMSMPDVGEDFPFPFPFPHPAPQQRGDGGDTRQRATASGSGVIVKSDAKNSYVLTNDHVVDGADRVTVKLKDGREFKGIVLRDPRTDLAVIKIEAKNLPIARLADSDKIKIGQWAIAIGNPFGQFGGTFTVGVVSGLTREFSVPEPGSPGGGKYYPDAIQTDASINPGNSGGPLVNIDGEVMGINSAIYSPSGGNVGVGFAIPSNTARFVMDQLISKGKVVRGYLGLLPENLTPAKKDRYHVDAGAVVTSVDDGSPAAKAGIEPEDVITSINGKKVADALELRRIAAQITPATKVKVTLVRDGKDKTVDLTLGEAPDMLAQKPVADKSRIGLQVETVTPDIAKELRVNQATKGVAVRRVTPGSAADRAEITQGDVILALDGQPTRTAAQFDDLVSHLKSGSTSIVRVLRGERTFLLEMTLD